MSLRSKGCKSQDLRGFTSFQVDLKNLSGRPEESYLAAKFPKQAPYIRQSATIPSMQVYDGYINFPEGYVHADAKRYYEEEMLKFYYGKNDLENYDKFLETLETTFNYKFYVEEALKQLEDIGLTN